MNGMTSRRCKLFFSCVVLLPACLLCCSSCLTSHLNYWPNRAMISEEQAREIIHEFLKDIGEDRGLSVSKVKTMLGKAKKEDKCIGEAWCFDSVLGRFEVSIQGGYVSEYEKSVSDRKGHPRDRTRHSLSEMQEFAEKTVRRIYPGFGSLNFKLTEVSRSGDTISYHFLQKKWKDEVSISGDSIDIDLRIDYGIVERYTHRSLPFRRTILPKITETEARRIVRERFCHKFCTIKEVSLEELPVDRATRSITIWSASVIYTYPQYPGADELSNVYYPCIFTIHAETGEAFKNEALRAWQKEDRWQREVRARWRPAGP